VALWTFLGLPNRVLTAKPVQFILLVFLWLSALELASSAWEIPKYEWQKLKGKIVSSTIQRAPVPGTEEPGPFEYITGHYAVQIGDKKFIDSFETRLCRESDCGKKLLKSFGKGMSFDVFYRKQDSRVFYPFSPPGSQEAKQTLMVVFALYLFSLGLCILLLPKVHE